MNSIHLVCSKAHVNASCFRDKRSVWLKVPPRRKLFRSGGEIQFNPPSSLSFSLGGCLTSQNCSDGSNGLPRFQSVSVLDACNQPCLSPRAQSCSDALHSRFNCALSSEPKYLSRGETFNTRDNVSDGASFGSEVNASSANIISSTICMLVRANSAMLQLSSMRIKLCFRTFTKTSCWCWATFINRRLSHQEVPTNLIMAERPQTLR